MDCYLPDMYSYGQLRNLAWPLLNFTKLLKRPPRLPSRVCNVLESINPHGNLVRIAYRINCLPQCCYTAATERSSVRELLLLGLPRQLASGHYQSFAG